MLGRMAVNLHQDGTESLPPSPRRETVYLYSALNMTSSIRELHVFRAEAEGGQLSRVVGLRDEVNGRLLSKFDGLEWPSRSCGFSAYPFANSRKVKKRK